MLAIGIVVDDAIVVVEGAAHNIEQGMSGHDAAISAMDALFAPIIGITLVLISVFLPAAFLPGLTGRMYAQFALVIAATALLSAINAATLKPTQCALWLRRPVPPEQRNWFYRGFNSVYDRLERGYAGLIGRMVAHSNLSVIVALILIGIAGYGLSRVPTGFIPIEDQGYLLAAVQLPDGAALDRTQRVLDQVSEIAGKTPGVDQVISIAGISALDNSSSLANAGVAYLILKEWSERGPGQDLRSLFVGLNQKLAAIPEARILVIPPPPIQGIGNAAGFAMQVELRDGNSDFGKLQAITGAIVANAQTQSALQRVNSSFRSMVPQFDVEVDRIKTQTLHVTTDQVFSTLASYLGSTYVNQFNKFGRTFQVYAQADAQFRLTPRDIEKLMVRNSQGDMIPLGTVATITPSVGPSLISLYNLYPSATIIGLPAQGYSSGQSMALMEEIAAKTLPPGTGYEWTAMSYQEKAVGNQIYYAFGLALLLVYLVLAGQYESWYAPISVILAVPLSLLGPMAVLTGLRIENNLYTQIGLILLIALSAKNAILIVEVALELHVRDRKPLLESAVEAARARFRPILMTSFAFILGVAPLVVASGAGASARKSIGITVFSGMIASTCLAVLFVPTFFVVVQRFENWLAERKRRQRAVRSQPRRRRALHPRWDGKRATRQVRACPGLRLQLDHPLAAVLAGQQSDQRLRRILKAIDDVFLDFQLAGGDPRLQVAQCLVALIHEVHHDEALHDQALHHDQAGHAARPGRRRHAVILRDRAAAGDAAAIVHLRQAGFENVAADIVEIDVDAFRRRGLQRLERRTVLVIDRGIEAEFAGQPVALVLAAGDADDMAALDLGDLADDRSDRAGRGRDHDGLAGLRLADIEQPEIGGEAGDAVDAEQMRHRLDPRHLAQVLCRHGRIILPAGIAEHDVARGQARRFR